MSVEMYSVTISSIFFSSRRRHTRWPRDWSSDVCSSDLSGRHPHVFVHAALILGGFVMAFPFLWQIIVSLSTQAEVTSVPPSLRSEERRVGKECTPGRASVELKRTAHKSVT